MSVDRFRTAVCLGIGITLLSLDSILVLFYLHLGLRDVWFSVSVFHPFVKRIDTMMSK